MGGPQTRPTLTPGVEDSRANHIGKWHLKGPKGSLNQFYDLLKLTLYLVVCLNPQAREKGPLAYLEGSTAAVPIFILYADLMVDSHMRAPWPIS